MSVADQPPTAVRHLRQSPEDEEQSRAVARVPTAAHFSMVGLGRGSEASLAQAGYTGNRIFPLPTLDLPHAEKLNSRRSQRHRGEEARVTRLVNEQVDALNWLNSGPLDRQRGDRV